MDRVMQYNNLVVRVIRVQGLQLKNHKSLDIYVSLCTSGKNLQYKSKVQTNTITTTDGNGYWDESCEFQLNELENELTINVNYKGKLRTENLGNIHFDLNILPQFQPPKGFKLTKKGNDDKERGQIFLGFEFSNKMPRSISNFSINTIGGNVKEKKLDYLKRKIHFGKKKNKDAQSLASVNLSRKSSFSSITSALAFNSPSPNQMRKNSDLNDDLIKNKMNFTNPEISIKPQLSPQGSITSLKSDLPNHGHKNRFTKVREKAEKWLKPSGRKNSSDNFHHDSASIANFPMHSSSSDTSTMKVNKNDIIRPRSSFRNDVTHENPKELSRPTSIASSSGFASLGSNNISALNETTSPEYLLKVIEHLRKELHQKESKIKDMQEYLDKLLSRVIETNPEILQVNHFRRY